MDYLIGVDGGGTGCRVAVADMRGRVLARAKGGPANIATDLQYATKNILQTTNAAFVNAGIDPARIVRAGAFLGVAGSNLGDYATQFAALLPFGQIKIVNDSLITLEGALGPVNGTIAAIGTGSVFACRDEHGTRMLGGWGFVLGDDGSGARLGQDLLRRSILAHDGVIGGSELTASILAGYNNRPEEIIDQTKDFTPRDFGKLAPQLVGAAQQGDRIATEILEAHTELVRASIDAVGFEPDRPFAMLGGLGQVYLDLLPQKYRDAAVAPKGNALDGAVSLAYQNFT